MTPKHRNRRAATRFAVQKPVEYRVAGEARESGWKQGHAVDMSGGGILIAIPETVPVGADLEIAMEWPRLDGRLPSARLILKASVVRIDRRGTALRTLDHRYLWHKTARS